MALSLDINGLVFDTTCLSHFAIADRIDVLGHYVSGVPCYSTTVVLDEIRRGAVKYPQLEAVAAQEWISFQRMDSSVERLTSFVRWTTMFGSQNDRDLGEASVMAVAAELNVTALVDDQAAKRVALQHHGEVHGTLWLLAEVWRVGGATEVQLCNLVNALADSGMRLPCNGTEFPDFVKENKLGRWAKPKR